MKSKKNPRLSFLQIKFGVFSVLFIFAPIIVFGQIVPDVRDLMPAQSVEREIKSGEIHRYKISLQKDGLLQINVEQTVVNISLKFYDSAGNELITAEKNASSKQRVKTLSLSYIAVADGDFFLEVVAPKIGRLKYGYKLNRLASRAATEAEKEKVADLFANEAEKLDTKSFKTTNKTLEKKYRQLAILKSLYAFSIYERFESTNATVGKIKCARSIGVNYTSLEDNLNAAKYFELSLKLLIEWENQLENPDLKVAKTILYNDLGKAYSGQGEVEKALSYLEQVDFESEEYWKKHIGILRNASDTLHVVLIKLEDTESYSRVINLQKKLIGIAQRYKFSEQEMYLYSNLGSNYLESGIFDKAMESYEKAEELNKKHKDRELSDNLINSIGTIYLRAHNYAKARDFYLLYLKKTIAKKDELNILLAKANLGCAYVGLKQYSLAKKYLEETLPQIKLLFNYEKAKNYISFEKWVAMFVVEVAVYYGILFRELNQLPRSTEIFKEYADLAGKYKVKKFQSMALNNLGLNYLSLKDFESGATAFQEALQLSDTIDTRDEKIAALDGLMRSWEARSSKNLAIIYGKQSVNLLQTTRAELEKIEKGVASEFVKNNENTYRFLANLLIAEGRLREAHIVLDMLKVEEFKELVAKRGFEYKTIEVFDDETAVIKNRSEAAELSRRQKELEESRQNKCGNLIENADCRLSENEERELAENRNKLGLIDEEYLRLLEKMKVIRPDLEDRIKETQKQKNLTTFLKSHNAVAIYTVVGDNPEVYGKNGKYGWILLVLGNTHIAYPIDTNGLNDNIAKLQEYLRSDVIDPKTEAQNLYNRIFRQKSEQTGNTLEEDLKIFFKSSGEKVIMWSLDGILRDVPMAVLHNGQNYLVEEYIQTIFSSESILLFNKESSSARRILGFGVTMPKTVDGVKFEELKGVEKELREIIRQSGENTGIIDGVRVLDDKFKSKEAISLMWIPNYSILHFATHYRFFEDKKEKSFLVTGDGKLTLEDLDKTNIFDSVDIATFSACETLSGGRGKENEGLAVLVQGRGAKTVIASLWKISDVGTPELMIQFYKRLNNNPNISKGEAFREAQLSLLKGAVKGENESKTSTATRVNGNKSRLSSGLTPNVPTGNLGPQRFPEEEKKFKHPHYWASFVMVGNWR